MPSSSTGQTVQEAILHQHHAFTAAHTHYFVTVLGPSLPAALIEDISSLLTKTLPRYFYALLEDLTFTRDETRNYHAALSTLQRARPDTVNLLDTISAILAGVEGVLRRVGRDGEADDARILAGEVLDRAEWVGEVAQRELRQSMAETGIGMR